MKVVINRCFGGFGLSDSAYEKLGEWGIPIVAYPYYGKVIYDRMLYEPESINSLIGRYWDTWIDENRTDPILVKLVETMGDAVNSQFSNLKIVDIPDGTDYGISEYDGLEHVAEVHRTWR